MLSGAISAQRTIISDKYIYGLTDNMYTTVANSSTQTPTPPPTFTPFTANSSTQTPEPPSTLTPATANSFSQATALPLPLPNS